MDDTAPVRINFEQGSAAAVNRTFIGWFFVFAVLFAGAAFYRPAIHAFAVGFPVYLIVWKLRLRMANKAGWALVVTPERLVLESPAGQRPVLRNETAKVRIDRSQGRGTFELLDLSGSSVLRQELSESDLDRLTGALRDKGWTLEETSR